MDESAIVSVEFKRMKEMRNNYKYGGIRPVKVVKAVPFLKNKKNPHNENIMIKCMFCDKAFEKEENDIFNHVEQCHLDAQS